jgi:hypothetical protein
MYILTSFSSCNYLGITEKKTLFVSYVDKKEIEIGYELKKKFVSNLWMVCGFPVIPVSSTGARSYICTSPGMC